MPASFQGLGLPSAIGSLPHTDPVEAVDFVKRHFHAIPFWPQLPRRSFRENMYAQFAGGMPSLVIDSAGERVWVDREADPTLELTRVYEAFLEGHYEDFPMHEEEAAGLFQFLADPPHEALAVKGQITGPISWGLTVVDQDRRPVLYDEMLADGLAKLLHLKAAWQEERLHKVNPNSILFVDEPYLASFGSAFISLSREQVVAALEDVFAGLSCWKGIHCCGNTDWGLVLSTSVDILSFDAWAYAHTVALYPDEVGRFLERGGTLAWGVVPANFHATFQTVDSCLDKLLAGIDALAAKGLPREQLLRQSLITPSCGLGTLSVDEADFIMHLVTGVSERFRTEQLGLAPQWQPEDNA